jgi:L-rhamnonate dehydratase
VFGSGIRLAATLQVLCSCNNSLYLEYDVSENPLRTEILRQPIKPVRGVFSVPEAPGIGVELNEEIVRRLED